MTEKIKYLEDMKAELAQALGEAIWAFAMIERLTYRYMKKLSNDRLDELMSGQQFRARTDLVIKLVERLEGQEKDKAVALRYLREAQTLANERNLLAHNPWDIWIDLQESTFKTEIRKFNDETKKVDLEKVRDFRERAGEVASTLDYVLGELRFPGP